ncbi:MAG: phosphatidylserine decarboxylase [Verrucomicrobia subdivision 3 bacterium]|nr:phosphatidylserine decarboxylase [Limisphaerales bacterium]
MVDSGIQFYNRYTDTVENEVVYGERWLRWILFNPFGQIALHAVAKRAWFSRWYGWRMSCAGSASRVKPFIEQYGIAEGEHVKAADEFTSFNDFFYRKLKPGARPVDAAGDSVVFPADGRHLGFAKASEVEGVFVKGQQFDLPRLLGDASLVKRFADGAAVFSRLCPVDYHRFHFPVAGVPQEARLINGPLYSVNPLALRDRLAILWENKRFITEIKTEKNGSVLTIEIGATNVGSVNHTFVPLRAVSKGEEKGCFAFGGSATFTIFEPGRVELAADLLEHSAQRREVYAKVGDRMGSFRS